MVAQREYMNPFLHITAPSPLPAGIPARRAREGKNTAFTTQRWANFSPLLQADFTDVAYSSAPG